MAEQRSKGIWLGVAGLLLSAGLMIAMGFTKSVKQPIEAAAKAAIAHAIVIQ